MLPIGTCFANATLPPADTCETYKIFANENPGTCGAAARLPKKPGSQKLTPPSSARELVAVDRTMVPASGAAMTLAATFNRTNDRNFLVKTQRERSPTSSLIAPRYDYLSCALNPIRPQKADYA